MGGLNENAEGGPARRAVHSFFSVLAPVLFVAAVAWAACVHWTAEIAPFDDAYITFRYVDNLAAGKGMVYNEGERVLGSTTPLYLLLLALLKFLFSGVPTPVLAVHLNFFAFAATGLAAWLLLNRMTGNRMVASCGAAAMMADPLFLSWSLGGMESFLFAALMIFGTLAIAGRRPVPFGIIAGLACLTRPEGVLLLPIAFLMFLGSPKRMAGAAIAFTITIVPWSLFAWAYFGNPIPLSVIAKAKPLYPLPPGSALVRLLEQYTGWFTLDLFRIPDRLSRVFAVIILCLAPALALAALAKRGFQRRSAWLPAALFAAFVIFYAASNPMVFPWYLPPVFLFGFIALLTGLSSLIQVGRIPGGGLPAVIVVVAICAVSTARIASTPWPPALLLEKPGHMRIREYRTAAEKLNLISEPGERVAAPEIGSFGYYYHGPILDACGLVSPEAHPFLPAPPDQRLRPGQGVISREFVQETDPEYVVTMQVFAARSLGRWPWFRDHYQLIDSVPFAAPVWGSQSVQIFKRK